MAYEYGWKLVGRGLVGMLNDPIVFKEKPKVGDKFAPIHYRNTAFCSPLIIVEINEDKKELLCDFTNLSGSCPCVFSRNYLDGK